MVQQEIITDLSEEVRLKMEVIQSLLEPCDKQIYGERLKQASQRLGKSVRTVQRLIKKWEKEGISGFVQSERADKGKHRISEFWQDFILKTYREGNKGSKRMSRQQVALRFDGISNNILKKTEKLLFIISSITTNNNLWWHEPLMNISINDEIVLEWWHKNKKITIYVCEDTIDYIKVWGTDMENEMEDGIVNLYDRDNLINLWQWLSDQ